MTFTRSVAYAVSALVYMASQPPGRRSGAQEISARQGIPIASLEKILQTLRRHRLLRAVRGTGGGYALAIPPREIRLIEVLRLFGEDSQTDQCLLQPRICTPSKPCPLHRQWADLRRKFLKRLARTTVADLVAEHPKGERT
jgi:Rrf2 family iron-sulfur cluster assembly transcriptional regulator